MPDYMFLLESRLSPEQRAVLTRVQELSAAMGFNVYLTGGTVRDLVTGASLRDLDFTVEGNPAKIARELEKGGAKVLVEDDKLRHIELLFGGDVEGSISAARDDHYVRPGTRPEVRWSTIMEDLRRRDFSLNAVAISLNPASRGLLLDPTNGLSDIERAEVRALTIHAFTNQPVRLLRVLRFAARMGFKIEARTQEWFDLAVERELPGTITTEDAGAELRALAREERPSVVLKAWEDHDLLEAVSPVLAKKRPGYDSITRLANVREDLFTAGLRPRLATPMLLGVIARLKDREQSAVLSKAGYRSAEAQEILNFDKIVTGAMKELTGKKMNAPIDAFKFLEKLPLDQIAYIMAESGNSAAVSKIRAYLNKWRPIRSGLPQVISELTALGMPPGAKFDAIVQQVFAMQLTGRGKTPEEREKMLRKLSGIKEQPKKKEKEKKPKGAEKSQAALAVGSAAREKHAAAKEESKKAGKAAAASKSASGKSPAKAAKKDSSPARRPARASSEKKSSSRK
jgi:tRNA nucleotidyltransferase (CCA-adding enzyme)